MAVTASINTATRSGNRFKFLAGAAATLLLQGVLWARNAAGYIVNASDAADLKVIGIGAEEVDNSAGNAGDLDCEAEAGLFLLNNSADNPVDDSYIGQACFVEDNNTVSTDPGDHSIIAGRVAKVVDEGVWVYVGPGMSNDPGAAITALAALTSTDGTMAAAADDAATKAEGEKIGDDVRAVHATLTTVIARLKAQGLLR